MQRLVIPSALMTLVLGLMGLIGLFHASDEATTSPPATLYWSCDQPCHVDIDFDPTQGLLSVHGYAVGTPTPSPTLSATATRTQRPTPTPLATLRPSPTVNASPTPAPIGEYCRWDGVAAQNVRSGPGTSYPIVGSLPPATGGSRCAMVIAEYRSSSGEIWLQLAVTQWVAYTIPPTTFGSFDDYRD